LEFIGRKRGADADLGGIVASDHHVGLTNGVGLVINLLPVDLDIVHPATGELEEGKQNDQTKGGYVAVRRDDETPVTKLVIRKGAAVDGMKYRLKFNAGANFKIWKDEARTQAVTSEQHDITLQAVINGQSHDAETVYTSVVEAEFDVWLNVFIPIQWTDFPAAHPIHLDPDLVGMTYHRKIAAGDDRSFTNVYFDNPEEAVDAIEDGTSSRVHTQVTIIPFEDLDADGIKDDTEKSVIGDSINYCKNPSVPNPDDGYSDQNRLVPNPVETSRGRAGINKITKVVDSIERGNDGDSIWFNFTGSADNPIVNPSPAIDWDFLLNINTAGERALNPQWIVGGTKQDAFPAYEIYVRDSDGKDGDRLGTKMYQYDPIPLGRTPADLFPAPLGADETVFFDAGDIP